MLGFCCKFLGFCWNFWPLSNSTSLYFPGLFGVSVEYCGAEGCDRGNMPEELSGSFKRRSRLERSASVNDIDDRGWTLLHVYARKGDLKGVCSLFCFFFFFLTRYFTCVSFCVYILIYSSPELKHVVWLGYFLMWIAIAFSFLYIISLWICVFMWRKSGMSFYPFQETKCGIFL